MLVLISCGNDTSVSQCALCPLLSSHNNDLSSAIDTEFYS